MEIYDDFSKWKVEEIQAVLNAIGPEKAKKFLDGEIILEFKDTKRSLFDKDGIRTAYDVFHSRSYIFNYQTYFAKFLKLDFSKILYQLQQSLGYDVGISSKEFEEESERLMHIIRRKKCIRNITLNTAIPVVIPKLLYSDLGKQVDCYLNAISNSYVTYSGKKLLKYTGSLKGRISVSEGSRQERLVERIKEGPVVGIYCPNALHGFSRTAQLEQMSELPENLILSGLDVFIAMIMYPDIFSSLNCPDTYVSGLQHKNFGSNFLFQSSENYLCFGSNLSPEIKLNNISSGGLLFVS
jgi:hypothetical protein